MPKFKRPTDTEIKERAAKRQYLNYGQYTLQGLEIISEQVDQLSKQFDQIPPAVPGSPSGQICTAHGDCEIQLVRGHETIVLETG